MSLRLARAWPNLTNLHFRRVALLGAPVDTEDPPTPLNGLSHMKRLHLVRLDLIKSSTGLHTLLCVLPASLRLLDLNDNALSTEADCVRVIRDNLSARAEALSNLRLQDVGYYRSDFVPVFRDVCDSLLECLRNVRSFSISSCAVTPLLTALDSLPHLAQLIIQ